MRSHNIVIQQTLSLILGQLLCCGAMIGIYALLGRLDRSVLLGAGVGAVLATGNFFLMALFADMAADKGMQQDVSGGQALIQLSYIGRLVVLFLALVVCARSGLFDLIALVLPLVFVRPILTVNGLRNKKGGEEA